MFKAGGDAGHHPASTHPTDRCGTHNHPHTQPHTSRTHTCLPTRTAYSTAIRTTQAPPHRPFADARTTTGVPDVAGTIRHVPRLRSRTYTHNLLFNSVVTPNSNYWLSSPDYTTSFIAPSGRITLKVIRRFNFSPIIKHQNPLLNSEHSTSTQVIKCHTHTSHMQHIT